MKALSCPPELWSEFSRLLDEALDLPEPLRAGWLAQLPARHAAVLPWLRRVLENPAGPLTADYLQAPQLPAATAAPMDADFAAGQRVGPWQLLAELGRGGMGVVWRARRVDGALQREAALKLPHAHLLAGALRERFDRERDILAALTHPHIAALYDAGLADGGQPWLALELVEGVPISDWCRERRLGLGARLDLFAQVLAAVQYAHARLIVHRDLKPSNVLVDGAGQVKLLDFGIAKLLDGESGGAVTALTQLGGRAATPDYAAPEQLAGGAVTTATDVHALGAMLYELLCGQRPHARAGRTRLSLTDAADGEAPLASSRVEPAQAESLGLTASALRRALRGDLDAILAKALSPAPEQRYATVEAFAADLDRARRHEPIVARRIGRLQLAGKFLRRHRLGAALSSALLLAVAVGIAGVLWQAGQTRQEARRAEAIRSFLLDVVFKPNDARILSDRPPGELSARDLLDAGVERIPQHFADDPQTQAELLREAASIYLYLGDPLRAQGLLERRIALLSQRRGALDPAVIEEELGLVWALLQRGQLAEMAVLLDRIDDKLHRAGLDRHLLRAEWWLAKSDLVARDGSAAGTQQQALERALTVYEQVAPGDSGRIATLGNLGALELAAGQPTAALAHLDEGLRLQPRAWPQIASDRAKLTAHRARALLALGRIDEARAESARAQQLFTDSVGLDSPLADEARAVQGELERLPR